MPSYTRSIPLERARALAVDAAGLSVRRPPRARSGAQARRRAVDQVGALGYVQVDSVNVLARAQDMVLFSRLGAVPRDVLTVPAAPGRAPDLVEHWAHEASVLTPATARLLSAFPRDGVWGSRRAYRDHEAWEPTRRLVLDLLAERPDTALGVADRAAAQARAMPGVPAAERRRFAETCAVHALAAYDLVGVGRTPTFQRLLARPEILWPGAWDPAAPPPREQAALDLTRIALRGLGIARTSTVADWFRVRPPVAAKALARLEGLGEARRVAVDGTRERAEDPWWAPVPSLLDAPARIAEGVPAGAVRLLSPFDPLVAHRPRLLELFGVHYRIGIYTPVPQRAFGYYDLLALRGPDIIGRLDLRADRSAGRLRVLGFWLEDAHRRAPTRAARALLPELARIARWQGLADIALDAGAPGDGAEAMAAVLEGGRR